MAAGDSLIVWHARDAQLHGYPAYSPLFTLRQFFHPVIEFQKLAGATTYPYAWFEGTLPTHYSGGPLVVRIMWTPKTAAAGLCFWVVYFERHDPSKNLNTFNPYGWAAIFAAPLASGSLVYSDITLAANNIPPGLAPAEHCRMSIFRYTVAADGQDTMAAHAQVSAVTVREAPLVAGPLDPLQFDSVSRPDFIMPVPTHGR